jgi:hypothetical protein
MRSKPKELVGAVRSAYVYEGLDQRQIDRRLRVPRRTFARWKAVAAENGDDWDTARAAMRLTMKSNEVMGAAVLEDFIRLFQGTLDDIKKDPEINALQKVEILARMSDAYNKTLSAMRRSSPTISKLSVAMEVLEMLADFVRTRAPEAAPVLLAVLEPFGEQLTGRYS